MHGLGGRGTLNSRPSELGQSLEPHAAGVWFGATVQEPESYTLVGCTVAPGFDFADFELANRATLQAQFSAHRALIQQLTR